MVSSPKTMQYNWNNVPTESVCWPYSVKIVYSIEHSFPDLTTDFLFIL